MSKSNVTSYPFLTKSAIKARIEGDDVFMLECLAVLYSRQTSHEQDTKSTQDRNRKGFMSSHAVNASTLAVKAAGEGLTETEVSKARDIVSHYTKQLASHFRQEAIASDPSLAEAARVFSAG
jgi:hypothetical protein